jgi:hypothetical protein
MVLDSTAEFEARFEITLRKHIHMVYKSIYRLQRKHAQKQAHARAYYKARYAHKADNPTHAWRSCIRCVKSENAEFTEKPYRHTRQKYGDKDNRKNKYAKKHGK